MISDSERHVITAIVDEDQLSLAIGRNGQNVRLASQLIGWQIDLYSSRDWLSRGAESSLFGGGDEYEVSDFPLSELEDIQPTTLAALQAAGINTFFDVLDMDRDDFLRVPGIGEEDAAVLLTVIDELTVEDELPEGSAPTGVAKAASAAPAAESKDEAAAELAVESEAEPVAESEAEPVAESEAEPVAAAVAEADATAAADDEPEKASD